LSSESSRSSFFNFGMNEASWRLYATAVRQARVVTRHQGRIGTHETESANQNLAELPPELARAIAPVASGSQQQRPGCVDGLAPSHPT
jgi:hypothetical protein